ncbi:hypothetical protein EK21DRAFT_115554 [Setomelanomma holmii]|uniref:F-box domain-containing protein n=1 Tax=Setomelanomma holmii TaxID=210430 RepID=A0A9P4LIL8_9PLEO|nr:hypothetical protein EK21DRAFT_115554 [Setomelanomma holmii]
MPTSGLLDLPSELLFDIIHYVAASPYPPKFGDKRYRPACLHSRAVVCFPAEDPIWPNSTRSLQLVCQRLHAETHEYLTKASQTFEFDVAIVNNHWIWPYWRFIPGGKIGFSIERLEINLIYCVNEDERESSSRPTPAGATEIEFLKVVSHFLRYGLRTTSFEKISSPKARSNFRIKHLAIKLDTSKIASNPNKEISEVDIPLRRIDGLAHLSFEPLFPIDTTTSLDRLDALAHFLTHALCSSGDGLTVRERVDYISMSADGQLKGEFDIAGHMSKEQEARIADYRRQSLGSGN